MIYVPWQRPGFDIGLLIESLIEDHPKASGVLLGHHGMSSWSNDDKTCYETALEIIDRAARYIEQHDRGAMSFGGPKHPALPEEDRRHTRGNDSLAARTGLYLQTLCRDAAV